ncbi:hypothetical protein BJ742DRAFT_163289 [Cladochytrium replicatum]|nr:hypothetical protein BJ742DRAFT_163289 [Cladochytrium replicatum]
MRSLKDTVDRLQAFRDRWRDGCNYHEVCLRAEMGEVLEHLLQVGLMATDRWKRLGLAGGVATPFAPDDPSGNLDTAKLTDQREPASLMEDYATSSKMEHRRKYPEAKIQDLRQRTDRNAFQRILSPISHASAVFSYFAEITQIQLLPVTCEDPAMEMVILTGLQK